MARWGTRNSVQREWIYDYIQRQDAHLSADEIYEGLLKEGKNISLATVYRNLSILVDEYKIASVMTDSKKQVYDKTCKPHDHFVCTKCHRMYDIDLPYDGLSKLNLPNSLIFQLNLMR